MFNNLTIGLDAEDHALRIMDLLAGEIAIQIDRGYADYETGYTWVVRHDADYQTILLRNKRGAVTRVSNYGIDYGVAVWDVQRLIFTGGTWVATEHKRLGQLRRAAEYLGRNPNHMITKHVVVAMLHFNQPMLLSTTQPAEALANVTKGYRMETNWIRSDLSKGA